MRTYTDFNAWKTACRERGWTGPRMRPRLSPPEEGSGRPLEYEFVGAEGETKAVWHADTNTGSIIDEHEPQA